MTPSGVQQTPDPRHGRHRVAAGWRRRLCTLAHAGRVVPEEWEHADRGTMTKPTMIVIGAWVVLAWNRFGPQALSHLGALTRFALVGVDSRLGPAGELWLVTGLRQRGDYRGLEPAIAPASLVRLAGLAHQPLLVQGWSEPTSDDVARAPGQEPAGGCDPCEPRRQCDDRHSGATVVAGTQSMNAQDTNAISPSGRDRCLG